MIIDAGLRTGRKPYDIWFSQRNAQYSDGKVRLLLRYDYTADRDVGQVRMRAADGQEEVPIGTPITADFIDAKLNEVVDIL